MKFIITICFVVMGMSPLTGLSQLNDGGFYSNFGTDADTRNNYMKYGHLTGPVASNDWFSFFSGGGIIDTSSASYYLSLLQGGLTFHPIAECRCRSIQC